MAFPILSLILCVWLSVFALLLSTVKAEKAAAAAAAKNWSRQTDTEFSTI